MSLFSAKGLIASIGLTSLVLSGLVQAASPIWTYSRPMPAEIVIVSPGQTSTVKYTVTNQSVKNKNLILKSTPGVSASSCFLAGLSSTCTLTLTIDGNQIPEQGLYSGPVLCEQNNPNQCYQPSASNQLRVSRTKNTINVVSVGNYGTVGQTFPLSYISSSSGSYWTATSPVLPFGRTGQFNDVWCNDAGVCVAVGDYFDGVRDRALAYISRDYGQSWIETTPIQGGVNNSLNSVTCTTNGSCVAVGVSEGGTPQATPLSYFSINYGQSWSVTSPLTQGNPSGLFGVSCNDTGACVAVGNYFDGVQSVSLSYTTPDFGQSWTLSLPPAYGVGANYLNSVSCDITGLCIAVGSYSLSMFPITYTSITYISYNHGQSWIISLPVNQGTGGRLFGVKVI